MIFYWLAIAALGAVYLWVAYIAPHERPDRIDYASFPRFLLAFWAWLFRCRWPLFVFIVAIGLVGAAVEGYHLIFR